MFFGFVLNKKISKFHYTNITQEYKSVLSYLFTIQKYLCVKMLVKLHTNYFVLLKIHTSSFA